MVKPNCSAHSKLVELTTSVLQIVLFGQVLMRNIIALWLFCFYWETWKLQTVYLFNLVITDDSLSICLPFQPGFSLRQKAHDLLSHSLRSVSFSGRLPSTQRWLLTTILQWHCSIRKIHTMTARHAGITLLKPFILLANNCYYVH